MLGDVLALLCMCKVLTEHQQQSSLLRSNHVGITAQGVLCCDLCSQQVCAAAVKHSFCNAVFSKPSLRAFVRL